MGQNSSIEHYWELADFAPNDAQREAIMHVDGPLLITAGPGSGKTRVLLWRAFNLIVFHGVDPSTIFLSTFTEKAAKQLQDGLRSLLALVTNETGRAFDTAAISVGTVHSLCQRLLVDRRFNPEHTRRRAPVLLDALGQYFRVYNRFYWQSLIAAGGYDDEEAAQRALNEYLIGKNLYSRHAAVQNCIGVFNRFSEENLDPRSVTTKDPTLASLLAMYEKYTSDLKGADGVDRVDFSLLQSKAFEYFTENDVAHDIFKHVIIDEYQDTNAIQERIFFRLAEGHKNICVVGDDDQALYRFRGATVENLVQFESRCDAYLGTRPKRIDLSVNYRSREGIVDLCGSFIKRTDWTDPRDAKMRYRLEKNIRAHQIDDGPAVALSKHQKADLVYEEIASYVKRLREQGTVTDYNQVAFLFPAMKGWNGMNSRVHGFIEAFKKIGVPYYAPRAGRFLEVPEAVAVFGLFQRVFGAPPYRPRGEASQGIREFQNWMAGCRARADNICDGDPTLVAFLKERSDEVATAGSDYAALVAHCESSRIDLTAAVPSGLTQQLSRVSGLSLHAQRALQSHSVNQLIRSRQESGNPVFVNYLINRVTALDWSVLDLFYQVNGFEWCRSGYSNAESGEDEGPICNLGLITQYLARFMEEYSPVLTGRRFTENRFVNLFFGSFLYALFRLGESEYEDVDDPFPKGRVPFLTIHQSKGLEFPVVVLGSVYRMEHDASRVEVAVRDLLEKEGEPLERLANYDSMRLFYVALSRAENLLLLPRYTHGRAASSEFKEIFDEGTLPEISHLEDDDVPKAVHGEAELGKTYSYTGDYLLYKKCPRNYMIYRKYGFVPSRGQSMFFGRLVHETIEDIHNIVISRKEQANA